jgi:hypothetical protein
MTALPGHPSAWRFAVAKNPGQQILAGINGAGDLVEVGRVPVHGGGAVVDRAGVGEVVLGHQHGLMLPRRYFRVLIAGCATCWPSGLSTSRS